MSGSPPQVHAQRQKGPEGPDFVTDSEFLGLFVEVGNQVKADLIHISPLSGDFTHV